MTGSIVAFFTCSVLVVAPAISAHALETEGTVETVDSDSGFLTLADGSRFGLPDGFDLRAVPVGTIARVVYEPVSR